MKTPVRLGLTLGDVGGIGPEIILRAVHGRWPAGTCFVIIGSTAAIEQECERLGYRVPPHWQPDQTRPARLSLYDPAPEKTCPLRPGRTLTSTSSLAVRWIEAAVDACMAGQLDGMVTGPISKAGLMKAGVDYPGHTEMIAARAGINRYGMMLTGEGLSVSLVTRHIPLSAVEAALSEESVSECISLTADMVKWMGLRKSTIAVCGLNPHAGDGGAIGNAEINWMTPLIRKLRRRGMDLAGPLAADTVFHKAVSGEYAAVVAMYHDQGLGPLKLHAFDTGVNVTMGLPFVRTSPDHGTAFDIAGTGKASPSSMRAAISMARDLALRPNPWKAA